MILETTEVRWFRPGTIPPAVAAWFRAIAPHAESFPERTDHYLRLPAGDGIGIKLREGRMEFKQRQGIVGERRLAAAAAGIVERWRKQSYALAPGENPVPEVVENPDWMPVRKQRKMTVIAAADGLCGLELTQAWFADEPWWSTCFEAYGDAAANDAVLLAVATDLLADAPVFHVDDSLSYPAVMRRMTT